jgi:hypothetical protein
MQCIGKYQISISSFIKLLSMKKILLFMVLIAIGTLSNAQTEFVLRFDHRLDDKAFALNQEATSPAGTKYKLTRLQYYISGVTITHDGGQKLILNNLYLFVDPSKPASASFSLGTLSGISNIEKIEFAVGVDVASNHLDPASYPSSHPLAPKNPTMHWGWTSGYRFIAVEGKAARANGLFLDDIAIHTVGDFNFTIKSYNINSKPENGKSYIDMKAEYNLLFDGITLAGGNNNHGESGSAAMLCSNASLKVFSPSTLNATTNLLNNKYSKTVYGSNGISIQYSLPENNKHYFNLYDSNGKGISESVIHSSEGSIHIDDQIISGSYYYTFEKGNQIVSTGKLFKR